MGRIATREDDGRVVEVLARRAEGETAQAIADATGLSRSAISVLTNRVFHDDAALSGEPREAVLRGYPWMA